jgi:hypothetical protein
MLLHFADRANIGQAGRASRRGTAGFRHPAWREAKYLYGWSLPRPREGHGKARRVGRLSGQTPHRRTIHLCVLVERGA